MPDVAGAKRIYQLMVLTAWADGTVEASEAMTVSEIVSGIPVFKEIGSKSEISKAMKARIDALGLDAAVREAAAGVQEKADRELAYRCCAKVIDADGETAAAETQVLATLQALFGLSADDVKRLTANLQA